MSSSSFRTASPRARFALTDREQSKYSIARAILAAADEADGELYRSNYFELEVSAEIERTIPATVKRHGGLFVPYSLAVNPIRAGLDTKTTTKGKELVFTEPGPFIEFLYNKSVVRQLGAEVLDGLQSSVGFPKRTGKSSGSWVAENPGSDVADSNLTLGQILMTLHTYSATTRSRVSCSPSRLRGSIRSCRWIWRGTPLSLSTKRSDRDGHPGARRASCRRQALKPTRSPGTPGTEPSRPSRM